MQGTRRRVGFLATNVVEPTVQKAWLEGLRNHGWIDGRNLIIEYRCLLPGSPASFRQRTGSSQPRSAYRPQPTSSRSPEIGNCQHSDCIRGCVRSGGARSRAKPIASRRQQSRACAQPFWMSHATIDFPSLISRRERSSFQVETCTGAVLKKVETDARSGPCRNSCSGGRSAA